MKALICNEFGPVESHKILEIPEPEVLKNHVLVDVKATGIAFPDVLMVKGEYQFKPVFPFSPDGEIAGVISEVGEGITQYKVGDRVIAYGSNFLREKALATEAQLFPLPETMDYQAAAAFPLNYGTNYHGFKQRAGLKEDESALILGAGGGLGISAIHVAKAMGAEVIAAASSQEKLDLCKREGADETILYERDLDKDMQKVFSNKIKEISDGGVNIVYDIIGGNYSEPALRAIARHGRYLVVGFTAGIPKIPLNLTLLKECQIIGVFWGQFQAFEYEENGKNYDELFELHASGKIKPFAADIYTIDDSIKALKSLEERKAMGKVVVSME